MRNWVARATGLVLLGTFALINAAIAGNSRVVFVPWKVVEPGQETPPAPLTLYWIPASPDELRRSELVTSRALALFATRCVGMQVIRGDDEGRLETLGVGDRLPVVVLMDGDRELGRLGEGEEPLRAGDVETMVREAIDERELVCETLLDDARERAIDGDRAAAIELYRHVWQQRCAFPRQAREAQRALKRLGITPRPGS
jgi:hypothetical protein